MAANLTANGSIASGVQSLASTPPAKILSPPSDSDSEGSKRSRAVTLGLKRVAPYWAPLRTMAKGRWLNREILELVSTEFRDRSIEYYRFALEAGVTSVNGKIAKPGTIIKNGDCIQNIVHRHEPPVTSIPIEILVRTPEYLVVNKPGSIPVHGVGRYYKQTLVYMLQHELGIEKIHTVNRLDRLTSGLLILPLVVDLARTLGTEFVEGKVQKEYIARCKGKFPNEEITCDQPLLTIDRQMGLNVVHPEGKPAQTIFKRLFYDKETDSSVLHCRPLTGRSHQIRVHLQYLGHPIANDPVYNGEKIWGRKIGRGGVDTTPSEDRAPPIAPDIFNDEESTVETTARKLLPRETGKDIGMGSPVPLSEELVGVITRLRNMKDENEDWSRWRDVVFRGQKLTIDSVDIKGHLPAKSNEDVTASKVDLVATGFRPSPNREESTDPDPSTWTAQTDTGTLYCKECFLPLHPDPSPEDLYIFLHAFRYTTECLGSFETSMPHWAEKGWTWVAAAADQKS
ncbi:pseudouridine synthase [Hysterangium stoloniferum]|nr:pseudouridine synthase [Hysterangium stoloniferum]